MQVWLAARSRPHFLLFVYRVFFVDGVAVVHVYLQGILVQFLEVQRKLLDLFVPGLKFALFVFIFRAKCFVFLVNLLLELFVGPKCFCTV